MFGLVGTVASNKPTPTALSRFLRRQRIAKKKRVWQAAQAMGVSAPTICNWESGKARPSIFRLQALARFLEIDVEELLNLSQKRKRAA